MEAIIHEHGLPEFQVSHAAECNTAGPDGRGVGGRSGFRHCLDSGIPLLKRFDDLRAFLLVSDNDKPTSFRQVQDELREAGHTPPSAPADIGIVFGKPTAILLLRSRSVCQCVFDLYWGQHLVEASECQQSKGTRCDGGL
jgi:hypothetical protein